MLLPENFHDLVQWAIANSYWLIFLAMCVEGPVTTAAAGFASALGYFDPWIIFLLSILGDLLPDSLYYFLGSMSRFTLTHRLARRFGLREERLSNIERLLHENFGMAMIALKFTPVVPVAGFMLIGALNLSFRRFLLWCTLLTLPKAALFLLLGYFFGAFYNFSDYLHRASTFLPVLVAIAFGSYFLFRKITDALQKKTAQL
ncbi:MAG: VTT domain-containing protein [Candidatus Moraniibacteriota bacterium]